jgi:hypothetical protein
MATENPPNNYPGCDRCADGDCPYWYQDIDGVWHHDKSGGQGYVDDIFFSSPGIGEALPTTDGKEKKRRK